MRFDNLEAIAGTTRFDDLIGILRARIGNDALMIMLKTAVCH